jgi:peroxiredoxin
VPHAVRIDTPAPYFELADHNGKTVRLSDYAGRRVVLVLNRGFS